MQELNLPKIESASSYVQELSSNRILEGCNEVVFPSEWWQEQTPAMLKNLVCGFGKKGYVLGRVDDIGVHMLALDAW